MKRSRAESTTGLLTLRDRIPGRRRRSDELLQMGGQARHELRYGLVKAHAINPALWAMSASPRTMAPGSPRRAFNPATSMALM